MACTYIEILEIVESSENESSTNVFRAANGKLAPNESDITPRSKRRQVIVGGLETHRLASLTRHLPGKSLT